MAIHRMDLAIEAKEDETGEGVQPRFPSPGEAAVRLQDTLQDVTKHDGMIGWRVTAVTPQATGTALVSAADLSHLLDRVEQAPGFGDLYRSIVLALRRDLEASWAGEQP